MNVVMPRSNVCLPNRGASFRNLLKPPFFSREEEVIDVISELPRKNRPIAVEKAEMLMGECERHCNFANPDVQTLHESPDWEEKISK